ncbi:uncharacterized protein PHACADRAFT_187122 [Phanerochaete carnosa HHB-10118-sp]|uniref:F-box domain-containing protein n=1 Tax=Phanerochaete carnosa (strain HHB-10118-sp) TaxID=650164 RepID=K5VY02_PHACS|nr:uncharacterized protein PHACADRAFT_187122 [Phanerochaete carnosa HHB-10118-sp]EKM51700.1 hypothetical protein PHACADRAFT_187122 [Phanerochaete carnosa HHB-10118-sp]
MPVDPTVLHSSTRSQENPISHVECKHEFISIAKLPTELLEEVFLAFARDGRHSPVVLAQVCRLWREIAYDLGCLWRHIDLQLPEQAKHHLIHSQWQTLEVVWLNRSYGPGARQYDYREWLWTHSHRFATLSLVHTSKILSMIFCDMSPYLPELVDLTVIGQDIAMHLRVPIGIQASMPQLQNLNLSSLKVAADDLIQLLGRCSALKKIELIGITLGFTSVEFDHLLGEPSVTLPKLNEMSLVSLHSNSQCFIVSRLNLPPRSSLRVTGTMSDLHLDAVLHRDIFSLLQPCFTMITLGDYSVVLSEARNDKGCAVTLELLVSLDHGWDGTVILPLHVGDLSSVRILEFAGPVQQARFDWRALVDRARALEAVWLQDENGARAEMGVEEYRTRYADLACSGERILD